MVNSVSSHLKTTRIWSRRFKDRKTAAWSEKPRNDITFSKGGRLEIQKPQPSDAIEYQCIDTDKKLTANMSVIYNGMFSRTHDRCLDKGP
jgi:hypothetical protein